MQVDEYSSHLERSRSVKTENIMEGDYIKQNQVASIQDANRALIERLRSAPTSSRVRLSPRFYWGNRFQFTIYQNVVLLGSP